MAKKLLNIFGFLVGLAIILPAIVNAADFSLFSSKTIYTEDETFSVELKVEPKEDTIYTTKVKINYPADLLKIQSFAFAENWLPLTQTGYDLIDNKNGILIKTAGYPGGLSSSKTFGTIKFSVKKSGSAIIKVSNDSLMLNKDNQNVFSGIETKLTLNLKEKSLPKPEKKIEKPKPIEEKKEEVITEEITPPKPKEREEELAREITPEIPPIKETELKTGFIASLKAASGEITQSTFLIIVVILCLVALAFVGIREWCLYQRRKVNVKK